MGYFHDRAARKAASAVTVAPSYTLEQLNELWTAGTNPDTLSSSTYYTCLRVLAESVGKLPLKVKRDLGAGGIVDAKEHRLYDVLRYRPNPYQTSTQFFTDLEMERNHYGNAYARIVRQDGKLSLWRMPADTVQLWWDNAHYISPESRYWYIWYAADGRRYVLAHDEVLHFRSWLSRDGILGLPVRDILKCTVASELKAQQLQNKLIDNGFTAKAVVHYTGDLNDQNEAAFVQYLQAYAQGKVRGSESFIPLPSGTSIQPLGIKLTDAEFMALKRYSALQIAAAFGIKPDQIDDYTKSSYASSEAQQLAFWTDTMMWIFEHYKEQLDYLLLTGADRAAGYFTDFHVDAVLKETSTQQMEVLAKGVDAGIYTRDEARKWKGLPAKPGGGILTTNGNAIPVEMAGQQYHHTGT